MDITDGKGQAMRKMTLILMLLFVGLVYGYDGSCFVNERGQLDAPRCLVDVNNDSVVNDCSEMPRCQDVNGRQVCPVDLGDPLCIDPNVEVKDRTDSYVRFETTRPISYNQWKELLNRYGLRCADMGNPSTHWLCGMTEFKGVLLRGTGRLQAQAFELSGDVWLTVKGFVAYCTENAVSGCDQPYLRALGRLLFKGQSGRLYRINLHRDTLGCGYDILEVSELEPQEVRDNSVRVRFPEKVVEVRDIESITGQCVGDNSFDFYVFVGEEPQWWIDMIQVRGTGQQSEARFTQDWGVDNYLAFEGMFFYSNTHADFTANVSAWRAFEEGRLIVVGSDGRYYATRRPQNLACGDLQFTPLSYEKVEAGGMNFYRVALRACPEGFELIGEECQSVPVCPEGYNWSSQTASCEANPTFQCPHGNYNPQTGSCEVQVACPSGYTYNPQRQRCEVSANFQCPAGGSYNPGTHRCEAGITCPQGYTFNPSTGRCEASPTWQCPAGGTYNSSTGRCEANVSCPAGFTWNASRQRCEAGAQYVCPSGGSYNPNNGRCEASITCPSGYSFNPQRLRCEAQPACPSGFTFNNGQCTAPPSSITCPSGGSYNAGTGRCEASPAQECRIASMTCRFENGFTLQKNCNGSTECEIEQETPHLNCESFYCKATTAGFYSGAILYCDYGGSWVNYRGSTQTSACTTQQRVILQPSRRGLRSTYVDITLQLTTQYTCPSGYTLSGSICVATPNIQCPAGSTFNGSACIISPVCSGGVYDSGNMVCYANIQCPAGYTLQGGVCVADPQINCPVGGTYDSLAGLCWIDGLCPSGYTRHGSLCLVSPNPNCSGGSFDNSRNVCWVDGLCLSGYVRQGNMCVATTTAQCPVGSQYDDALRVCFRSPDCPSGYDVSGYYCVGDAYVICPPPGTYNQSRGMCFAHHLCPANSSYDSQRRLCVRSPDRPQIRGVIDWESLSGQCTLDNSFDFRVYIVSGMGLDMFRCMSGQVNQGCNLDEKIGVGISDNPLRCRECLTSLNLGNVPVEEEPLYEDRQPEYTEERACVNVRFFSGWRMSCRKGGPFTLGASCCGISGIFRDLCKRSEKELKKRREAETCKEVGDYCSKRIRVGPVRVCVEESKSFCCFNSRLSKILQECGRPQIGKGWGAAKNPDCSGFTMEEFQRLDFSNPECVRAIEEWVMEKAGSFGSVDTTGITNRGVEAIQRWLDDARNRPVGR